MTTTNKWLVATLALLALAAPIACSSDSKKSNGDDTPDSGPDSGPDSDPDSGPDADGGPDSDAGPDPGYDPLGNCTPLATVSLNLSGNNNGDIQFGAMDLDGQNNQVNVGSS